MIGLILASYMFSTASAPRGSEPRGPTVLNLAGDRWRASVAIPCPLPPLPPKPRCSYHTNMQLYDPGGKHTSPPVDALDEAACCVQCLESEACFGAELHGSSCFLKTAKLPLVTQIPPKGVVLVACVKHHQSLSNENVTDYVAGPPNTTFAAKVPGDLLAAMERADLLGLSGQSMYFGTNLASAGVRAAQNQSYWLNTTVTIPPAFLQRELHTLLVRGLDYNGSFYIDGELVGSHAGPYHPARIPISLPALPASSPTHTPAMVEVAILFHRPPAALLSAWIDVRGNGAQHIMWNYLDWWRSMVGIGYDFAQNVWPVGIQEGVWLVASDKLVLTDLVVLPVVPAPYTEATINATAYIEVPTAISDDLEGAGTIGGGSSFEVTLQWRILHAAARGGSKEVVASANTTATLLPGLNAANTGLHALKVTNPKLWYPRGFGSQPLYTLVVAIFPAGAVAKGTGNTGSNNNGGGAVAFDEASRSFGIRDLQHVQNAGPKTWTYIEEYDCGETKHHPSPVGGGFNCTFPDSIAGEGPEYTAANRNWTFQINGQRVFAHGANWLPCDMRISECTELDYEYLIGAAANANMNFLRVWGGGGVEKPAFYDACDRHGIMVYTETMHSQAMPTRDVNYANEAIEVAAMIRTVSSHPSVVRYGWGNEFYGVNRTSSRFERQYEQLAGQYDGSRRATHGSPVTWADRHGPYCFYLSTVANSTPSFPCYPSAAYDVFNDVDSNVMNQEGPNDPFEWDEYGAAGSSSVYTLQKVISTEAQFPIRSNSTEYIFHRAFDAVGAGSMWLVQDGYTPLFGQAPDLATEVSVSQWAQNEGLRYANQAHRRRMPHRSMSAFWTLNEPWPNAAYGSVVDWFGEKKHAYYAATQQAYAAIDISLQYASLFIVAGAKAQTSAVSAWVVAEHSVHGANAELTISTTAGTILHTTSWSGVSVAVAKGAMGNVVKLKGGAMDGWVAPPALAGAVVLARLVLKGGPVDEKSTPDVGSGDLGGEAILAEQLYTFAVLAPGSRVDENMAPLRPMAPLLSAPQSECTLSLPACGKSLEGDSKKCSVTIYNAGTVPCIYVKLELRDEAGGLGAQFHAADFSANYMTVFGSSSVDITFARLRYHDATPAAPRSVCLEAWNMKQLCKAIP